MRKITMKRKSKTNETTKNSTKADDVDEAQDKQDKEDSVHSNAENENGTAKKSRGRKSKGEVSFVESEEESNESVKSEKSAKSDKVEKQEKPEKRSSKKKNKKGRKSKSEVAEETNGTEEKEDKTEEEETFEVEQILDQKIVRGVKHYLIRWKGYGEESDTWEPETTLECPELVAKFNSRRSKGKKRSSVGPSAKSPKKAKSNDDSGGEETVGEYEVDRIIEVHFKKNGQREFLVHWKGYSANENTWEPEENMSCHDLIERFMEKVNKARETDSRELRVNRSPTKHFTLSMQQTGRRLSRRNLGKQRTQYQELD